MNDEQKKQVRDALLHHANKFETEEQAAEHFDGITAGTIAHLKNSEWDMITERLWNHMARQLGLMIEDWQPADTSAYLLLRILFSDAQQYAMNYSIAVAEGLGKTFTSSQYVRENGHTIYVGGHAEYNRIAFMRELLRTAGLEVKGTMPEMMEAFAQHMNSKKGSLLIIDDADKLKDRVLHLVVLLSNSILGSSGVVVMGGCNLQLRIMDGIKEKKAGFTEIYDSIGRRFITLSCPSPKDVELVCRANGLNDDDIIERIKDRCHDNLHVATQMIQQHNDNATMAA